MISRSEYLRDIWKATRTELGWGPTGNLRRWSKPYNAYWAAASRRERRHPQDEGGRDTRRHKRVRIVRAKRIAPRRGIAQ